MGEEGKRRTGGVVSGREGYKEQPNTKNTSA